MEKIDLNKNDAKLLEFCKKRERSVSELAKLIGIAPKNVSVRLGRLEKAGLIVVRKKGQGKKTLIRNRKADKNKDYIVDLLKKIRENGGSILDNKLPDLMEWKSNDITKDPAWYDKNRALLFLDMTPYVEKRIVLTEEGKKFLAGCER